MKIWFFLIFLHVFATDYYEVLGLGPDAGPDEIKKAFRKLSRQYHPDKNPGDDEAKQKYLEVTKAHDILSDSNKRQTYDIYGEEGLEDASKLNRQKGPDYRFELEVDLEDVYNGLEKETTIKRNELCKSCKGTGAKDRKTEPCKLCGGKGVRLQNVQMGFGFNVQMQVNCDKCGGRGYIIPKKCPVCGGKKVTNQPKALLVAIERGMDNGSLITFIGESEQNPDWFPGDIIFNVKVRSHSRFRREGNDLHTTVKLSLREALLGYKKEIPHLDGHVVQIEHDGVTQPEQVRIIKEEGMPQHNFPSNKGKLHVKFQVDLPKKLTDDQKEKIKNLF